jgi:hypothetical protein
VADGEAFAAQGELNGAGAHRSFNGPFVVDVELGGAVPAAPPVLPGCGSSCWCVPLIR